MRKNASSGEKIHEALEILKEASKEKRVELADLISDLVEKAKSAQSVASEKVRETASKIDDSAHEKPWLYVGGAAIVGVLIGLFMKSRHSGR